MSKVVEKVKSNYTKQQDLIDGESLGDEEDKFPGEITYHKPISGLAKDIVITVDNNLNVYGDIEEDSDKNPKYDIFESQYQKTGNIFYYEPDLSGFESDATYYVTYDENGLNERIYGRIDRVEKPISGWHDYEKKIWGNVVTVTKNNVTYWTWIPRYKYKLNTNTSDVLFTNINGNCTKIIEGQEQEMDTSLYTIPESFAFAKKDLKGYWVSKYEIQLSEQTDIEKLQTKVDGSNLEVTTTNPNGEYTVYLDGVKIIEHQKLDTPYIIKGLNSSKIYDVCVYSETNSRMVGRKKKMVNSVIKVDTSGFDKESTYYVEYDKNGKENIAGRMDKISAPINWYNYDDKIWANVVTVKENNVTYWTYIPRYEYDTSGAYSAASMSDVKFIPKTQITADPGYTIPESFTFNGEQLSGFWVSKYEIQLSESSGLEQISLMASSSDIEVTTSNPSGKYTVYLNGEKKATGVNLPYKISDLNSDTEYDICLYNEGSNRMVGSKKKSTVTEINQIIRVDLSGFNPDCTYYVTYDEKGENEAIGEKIQLDDKGNPTNIPKNWYNYVDKKWANIVTKGKDANGNELVTYWTYIPRYEYDISGVFSIKNMSEVKFISENQINADSGFIIPESFTFNGKQLAGFWVSKYEVQGTID